MLVRLGLLIPIGFLGASPFADAVGFPPVMRPSEDAFEIFLRILSGVIVGLAALALFVVLRRLAARATDYLGGVSGKPGTAVAISLLVCGTLCVLGVLVFEYLAIRQTGTVATSVAAQPTFGTAEVSVGVRVPFSAHLFAIACFIVGAALLAVGVWSGVDRAAPAAEAE